MLQQSSQKPNDGGLPLALLPDLTPQDLVGQRIQVQGQGRGLVVDFEKTAHPLFSDSLHTIEFDEGSEILDKQRRDRERQILHDDSPHASASTSSVDRKELQRAFTAANHHVHKIQAKLTTPQMLSLYALAKQTTHGDAPQALFDADEREMAKWKAWNGARGLKGGDAAMQYIQLLASIDPPSDPTHSQLLATPSSESKRVQVLLRRKKLGRWNNGVKFSIVDSFLERIETFYTHYAPKKLREVKSIASRFRGREDELFAVLEEKYGPHPSTPGFVPATKRVEAAAMIAAEHYLDTTSKTDLRDTPAASTPEVSEGSHTSRGHTEEKKWSDEDSASWQERSPHGSSSRQGGAYPASSFERTLELTELSVGDEEKGQRHSLENSNQGEDEVGGGESFDKEDLGVHSLAIIAATEKDGSVFMVIFPWLSLAFVMMQVLVLLLIVIESGGITCIKNEDCNAGTYCLFERCLDCAVILTPWQTFLDDEASYKADIYQSSELNSRQDIDYDFCTATDVYLDTCDYIKNSRKRLHVANIFVLFVISLFFGVGPLYDVDEALTDSYVFNCRYRDIPKDHKVRKFLLRVSFRLMLKIRVFILQPLVAGASIALLLQDDLTAQNILLNGLAITFIVEMDDMLKLFVQPATVVRFAQCIPGEGQDDYERFFKSPYQAFHWWFNRAVMLTLSTISFYIIISPESVVKALAGHTYCGDYAGAILMFCNFYGLAWSLSGVAFKSYFDRREDSHLPADKKPSLQKVMRDLVVTLILNAVIYVICQWCGQLLSNAEN